MKDTNYSVVIPSIKAMPRVRIGFYRDPHHGDNLYAALLFRDGWCGIGLRWQWHFYSVMWPCSPGKRRWYFGPFEFDWYKLPARDGWMS